MAITLPNTFDEQPVRRPGDFYRSKNGTPYVADPTGALTKPKTKADPGHVKRLAYGRPSGFGKLIEDMYSIQKWSERQLCLGFALDPWTLVPKALALIVDDYDTEEWRSDADGVVVATKRVAKAGIAAERGTHAHELTEDDDNDRDIITRIEAGEELGLDETVQRSLVQAWRDMLERDGLEILAVEAAVVHDGYRQAGTLDRIARLTRPLRFTLHGGEIVDLPAGTVLILDIKSGKRRRRGNGTAMYWQSYAVQVAVYAGAVPYDVDTDTRGTWPFEIDQHWAVIAHLDVLAAIDGTPSCDLVLVDIEAGRRAADLCLAAKHWASEHTVFSVSQLDAPQSTPATTVEPATEKACVALEAEPDSVAPLSPTTAVVAPVTTGEVSQDRSYEPALAPSPVDRLALVDARNQLNNNPDQGADLSVGFDELWDQLRVLYNTLDPAAHKWRSELVNTAMRRNVPFHAQALMTERTYMINKGLITFAVSIEATSPKDRDELLRALLALVIGDVALYLGVDIGHALGSLDRDMAERFADLVDTFNGPGLAGYLDDTGVFRLRAPAA